MSRMFAALCFSLCAAGNGLAQPWPDKPVRIIVPLSTGSTSDALARYVAARLFELWKQQAVIENAPGANA